MDDTSYPIVIWNSATKCSFQYVHCHSRVANWKSPGEMNTEGGNAVIDDPSGFRHFHGLNINEVRLKLHDSGNVFW